MSKHLEIERKWLIYKNPDMLKLQLENPVEKFITQYYNKEGRWRLETNTSTLETKYIHCVKKEISPGIVEENEKGISLKTFNQKIKKNKGWISKQRWEWKVGRCKFFLDFLSCGTIFLEVEVPYLGYEIILPMWLKDCIYKEVTGDKRFNNSTLKSKRFYPNFFENVYSF